MHQACLVHGGQGAAEIDTDQRGLARAERALLAAQRIESTSVL
jgi:hypothetical protein